MKIAERFDMSCGYELLNDLMSSLCEQKISLQAVIQICRGFAIESETPIPMEEYDEVKKPTEVERELNGHQTLAPKNGHRIEGVAGGANIQHAGNS